MLPGLRAFRSRSPGPTRPVAERDQLLQPRPQVSDLTAGATPLEFPDPVGQAGAPAEDAGELQSRLDESDFRRVRQRREIQDHAGGWVVREASDGLFHRRVVADFEPAHAGQPLQHVVVSLRTDHTDRVTPPMRLRRSLSAAHRCCAKAAS